MTAPDMLVGVVLGEHWSGGLVPADVAFARVARPPRERAPAVVPLIRRTGTPRVAAIKRRRLLHLLASEAEVPVVVLSASAGYGKSILASQWLAQCERPGVLLSLDRSDNDPGVLLNHLVQSFDRVFTIADELPVELSRCAPRIDDVVLKSLARELERLSPVEVILDNVQEVCERPSLAVLELLLDTVPQGSQLVLVTRTDLDLPLASRRVAGELLEIRAGRLAFDLNETSALAVRRNAGVSGPALNMIHERAEGWPAGIELALRAAEECGLEERVDGVRGTQRDIADYVLEAVLSGTSEKHETFLLATSVLQRFNGQLCDAVLGTGDSCNVLRELERSNSFLIPLDDHRDWYRYHGLFAETMRSELDRRHPGLASSYLSRAAEWHESYGSDPDEAFRCAHECGDLGRTGRIALACCAGLTKPCGHEQLRSWLEQCTSEEIASDPELAIAAAWLHLRQGEGAKAQRYAVAAEHSDLDRPAADGAGSICSSLANLRSALAYRGIHQMLADAEYVYASERDNSARWVVDSCRARGMALVLLGCPNEAISALREGLIVTTAAELAGGRVFCLGYLVFAAAELGRWPEARKWARQARTLIGEENLVRDISAPIAHTARATVLVHDGDLLRAAHELAEAETLGHLMSGTRWMTADMELRWGELSLHLGDRLAAREHAGMADAALSGYGDAGNLSSRCIALQERIARATDLQLTPAELRVLPFLPTHLLVKEIAARLYLSTATVKTHLHSIFNKLDASTRSEAVDKMEQLGLEAARALPAA